MSRRVGYLSTTQLLHKTEYIANGQLQLLGINLDNMPSD